MKSTSVMVILLVVAYLLIGAFTLSSKQEGIHSQVGEVWNQIDRCNQLLPRLEAQLAYGKGALDKWNAQITSARNAYLAAKESGDLEGALNAMQNLNTNIQLFFEQYPQYLNLTPVMTSLMDETAGCFNRIAYARGKLIESQRSYNVARLVFFPLGIFYPRMEILGENVNPASTVVPSTFPTPSP